MKILELVLGFCLLTTLVFAETYTGKAENARTNNRGIVFDVVIKDSSNNEVLRREQWVSTGVMTGIQAISAIKNVVDRMTQEIWAHIEGAKEAMKKKVELEVYSTTCDSFVEPKDRPSPQDIRALPIE